LPERALRIYRAAGKTSLSLPERKKLAEELGVTHHAVKVNLARVAKKLENPDALRSVDKNPPGFHETDPDGFASAVVALSDPESKVGAIAKKLGISPSTVRKLAKELDGELMPLKREIQDVRLEGMVKRFGTLAKDSVDAITPDKLAGASARDLAVISGIATQNWQLLLGQPTQRMEISDRREMNEMLGLILQEVERRGYEVDVTPEGAVTTRRLYATREELREKRRADKRAAVVDVSP